MKPIFRRKLEWNLSDIELRIPEVKFKAEPVNGLLSSQTLQTLAPEPRGSQQA